MEFSVTVKFKDTQYHLSPNILNQISPKQHWQEQWAEVSRKGRNQNNTIRSLLAHSSLYCWDRPGPLRCPQNKGRTSQHIISRFLNLEESTQQVASATLRRISLRPLWIGLVLVTVSTVVFRVVYPSKYIQSEAINIYMYITDTGCTRVYNRWANRRAFRVGCVIIWYWASHFKKHASCFLSSQYLEE